MSDSLPKTKGPRPDYYGGPDATYEPFKVIRAWGLSYHLGDAVAYIARAGKKPDTTALSDLRKAIVHLEQEAQYLQSLQESNTNINIIATPKLNDSEDLRELVRRTKTVKNAD